MIVMEIQMSDQWKDVNQFSSIQFKMDQEGFDIAKGVLDLNKVVIKEM